MVATVCLGEAMEECPLKGQGCESGCLMDSEHLERGSE